MKKLDHKKGLSATVSMLMTLAICHSVSVQASDIDIYSNSTGGETRIMFVLDTSSSMKATNIMKMACDAPVADSAVTVPTNNSETSTTTPSYLRYYCTANTTVETSPKTYHYKEETTSTSKTYKCPSGVTEARNCVGGEETSLDPYECSEVSGNTTYYFNTNDSWNRCSRGIKTYVFKKETINTTNYYVCNSPYLQLSDCPTVNALTSRPSGANTFLESADGFNYYGTRAQTTTQNVKYYDRITRLKDGMFAVLQGANGVPRLTDDVIAGLTDYATIGGRQTGRVVLTPKRLDADTTECGVKMTQRSCMLKKVAELDASSNNFTATARAYGVAAKSLIDTIGNDTSECNGNGIYYLTDGGPTDQDPTNEMRSAISGFSCPSNFNTRDLTSANSVFEYKSGKTDWRCIAKFTNELLNGTTTRPKIKTAAVGFGKLYAGLDPYTGAEKNKVGQLSSSNSDIVNINARYPNISNNYASTIGGATSADIANTALWGVYGRGGWYSASEADEVAKSILNFVDEVKPEFEPVTTGSPTLPQDALNPLRIQPYGYYASFEPKPQESTQLWVGNMNKYHIFNGELYDNSKTIRLIKTDGSLDSTAEGLWINGMKGQLPLGIGTNGANEQVANRTIYTNREITGTAAPYAASEIGSLKKVNVTTLFGTGTTALFANDPDKNYWLNLLGYNVAATGTVTLADLITKPELRQVGSVMHSTPILLTQSGKISYTSGTIDTTDRDDYLLFGSTQGLLHVVRAGKNATDANRGKEVFAFVPNEMMQNQQNAFLSETSSTLGKNNLFYGIDAPWTAYTQYVAKADGTLTVKDSGRVAQNASGDDIAIKGLQWVYGGLRMGGKSYYALNLSDLDNPELKFHIDPANSKIYKSSSTTTGVTALSYMGQSWSKPTIAYVNFGGEKKLVMFVGGGYDAGYEDAAYDQNTTTGGGAGVYMFDANNGDLLWWTSANATAAGGAEAFTDASADTINMKYSVVSQINAIDRDSDGLVDNLYFGDLGGQGFRVDLNNAATGADASAKKANFAKRVVRLFDEHATGGASPRFYEMPSVSIHDSDDGYVAAVAFSSGNRSSPLVGAAGTNQAGSETSAVDGVFVAYDKDVAKMDLYGTPTLTTPTALSSLNSNMSTGVAINGNSGWKYTYSSTAGAYKGMNELYALDGMLYVNVYHRDGTGIGGSCGAGVKGDSYVYQFCLPTGKCPFNTTTSGVPNRVKLGAGILGTGLGQGRSNGNTTGLIVNRPTTLNCITSPNLPECQEFTTTAKLRQLRWYETR
ncbi:pilus assembly protein PilC [Acinetobacter indicus]|uniref:PilC/PilY family type IV pilus protein n=1 Tax=Acinetobacter indicus TaxID=756892 RepID=UPI00257880B2|nr:PilC/PilY family type IV pilus protein [Acinetobacter indicus]MDM1268985.1 pilus assembly protein PilC [Acinetobacter indicus]